MTTRNLLTLLGFLLIASTVQAETIRDRSLHVEPFAFIAAGQAADIWITTKNFGQGCSEMNRSVFGAAQPSVGRLIGVKALGVLPAVVTTFLLQKSGHQRAATVVGGIAGSIGFSAAAYNLTVHCGAR